MIYIAIGGFVKVNILKNYKRESAEINYSNIVYTHDSSDSSSSTNSGQREIGYSYFVNDKKYEGKDIIWWRFLFNSDINLKNGDKIEIYYNINSPSQSKIYHVSYVLMIVAICFIVFPILMLRQRIREN